jgi:Family of unknown function (DUF5681)
MDRKPVRLTKRTANVAPNSIACDVLPKVALPDGCSKVVTAPRAAESEALAILEPLKGEMRSTGADITVSKQRGHPFPAGVSGNPNGRPKGARNKLTETFLDIVAKDFAENGAEAIERVRREDPVMYLRIVGSLVPRELIAKREQEPDCDYSELTDDEIVELIEAERRRSTVQQALQSTSGR